MTQETGRDGRPRDRREQWHRRGDGGRPGRGGCGRRSGRPASRPPRGPGRAHRQRRQGPGDRGRHHRPGPGGGRGGDDCRRAGPARHAGQQRRRHAARADRRRADRGVGARWCTSTSSASSTARMRRCRTCCPRRTPSRVRWPTWSTSARSPAGWRASTAASTTPPSTAWARSASPCARRSRARHVRVTLIEPGATATELAFHNRPEILEGMAQNFAGIEIMHAEDIAEAIRYAVTQPRRVAVNEILVRPTEQER